MLKDSEMSWMNKRTGRPREQSGHQIVNISIDKRIFNILEVPENRSKYVEYCVNACTETKWIASHESSVTVNDNFSTFKTAATFVWVPDNSVYNGIVSTLCTFKYQCTGKAFRFRMRINGTVMSSIEVQGNTTWSLSQVYTESSFDGGMKVQTNQDSYIIEFQFEPYGSSDRAYVRDISMFLEIVDGLPTIGNACMLAIKHKSALG
jgi:hypothetical protein